MIKISRRTFNIKSKRNLILFSSIAFLVFLAISPSILAYSGTVRPDNLSIIQGILVDDEGIDGALQGIQDSWDGDHLYIKGSGGPIYKISLQVLFPAKTNVGGDNIFIIRFLFSGSGELQINVHYQSGSPTEYSETRQSTWLTKGYIIDDNRVVSYIHFINNEWWNRGHLYLDVVHVVY